MSSNDEGEGDDGRPPDEAYMQKLKGAGMLSLVNMTHGHMEADMRAAYGRVEAAISDPKGDPKAAYMAAQKRLQAWFDEFEKLKSSAAEWKLGPETPCMRRLHEILTDISESFHEITAILVEAGKRKLAALREQERKEVEEFYRDIAAANIEHQKKMNEMQRDFFWKLPANRWANKHVNREEKKEGKKGQKK